MQREMVSIFGATGSGKSTKLGELLRPHTHVVAVDPSGDREQWRKWGFTAALDLPAISAALSISWVRGFKLVLFPPSSKNAKALDGMSWLLFQYSKKHPLKKVALAVDEMAECYNNSHQSSNFLTGFREVILQGRHINLSVYGVTQRPQDVATQFRANCPRKFIFALHDDSASDVAMKYVRKTSGASLPTKDFHYLEINRGVVTQGITRR